MFLQELANVAYPIGNELSQTPTEQLRYATEVTKQTINSAVDATKQTFEETSKLTRGGKIKRALWATMLSAYTVADDYPAGLIYTAAETAGGRPFGAAAIGVLSSGLAYFLASTQRRRIIRDASNKGVELDVQDRSKATDVISTYGIGAPATTLSYPRGTVPSRGRVLSMSAFYGFVGQGLSYAGLETVGEVIDVNPKLMLAVGITSVVGYRYAKDAVHDFEAMTHISNIEHAHTEEIIPREVVVMGQI